MSISIENRNYSQPCAFNAPLELGNMDGQSQETRMMGYQAEKEI